MDLSPNIDQSSQQFTSALHCLVQQVLKRGKEKKYLLYFCTSFFSCFHNLAALSIGIPPTYTSPQAQRTPPPPSNLEKYVAPACERGEREGGERGKILIRHFNKEYTEFFPPCPRPLSWLRNLSHSWSFQLICFPTSFTSVYLLPTFLPPLSQLPFSHSIFLLSNAYNFSYLLWPFKMHFLILHKKSESIRRLQLSYIQR